MIATGAYRGGVRLTGLRWVSPAALQVRFESLHTDCIHRLYAGRDLIGQTLTVEDRFILASLTPSDWPPPLSMVAVLPDSSDQEFGDLFPPDAFNRPRLSFTASGGSWDDAKLLEFLTGELPGDPIDTDNVIGRRIFEWQGAYEFQLPALAYSGHRALRVQARDNRPPSGNVGDSADVVVRTYSAPPDLVGEPRFAVSVAAGVATIDCEVP